jgi:hypothetical protein
MSGKAIVIYTPPLKAMLSSELARFMSKWSLANILNKIRLEKRTDTALLSSPQGG